MCIVVTRPPLMECSRQIVEHHHWTGARGLYHQLPRCERQVEGGPCKDDWRLESDDRRRRAAGHKLDAGAGRQQSRGTLHKPNHEGGRGHFSPARFAAVVLLCVFVSICFVRSAVVFYVVARPLTLFWCCHCILLFHRTCGTLKCPRERAWVPQRPARRVHTQTLDPRHPPLQMIRRSFWPHCGRWRVDRERMREKRKIRTVLLGWMAIDEMCIITNPFQ